MNQSLTQRANQFGLILDDISITHLTFGREFTQAVELKQVAQQEAEKARFLVEKAEQIKQANIISAEGDTQAAELLATAIGKAGEGLVELRRIETAEEIASDLSVSRNIVYLLRVVDTAKDSYELCYFQIHKDEMELRNKVCIYS